MNKKLYFTLSMLFILFIALFLWPNMGFAWQDPTCAPPLCNRPQPITVEGGTILSGSSLIMADGDTGARNIIIDDTGISIAGGRIEGDKSGTVYKYYYCAVDEDGDPVCSLNIINTSEVDNTYLSDVVIVDDDILVTADHTINMSGGNSSIYIHEGREGPWGYGLMVRAHASSSEASNTIGIWGATVGAADGQPIGVMGDSSVHSDMGIGVFAVTNGMAAFLGGPATSGKIALQAEDQGGAESPGYAAVIKGSTDILLYREGDYGNNFTIRTSGVDWDKDILTVEKSDTIGLDNIFIDGDLWVGGNGNGDNQICLNDDCISEWPSGQSGGTAVFKTISVSGGSSPVADNASDTLLIINGNNISVGGNAALDSIGFDVNPTMIEMVEIGGAAGDYLYLNGDDAYGVQIYDKLTVDGDLQVNELTANCANVTTNASKELTCGVDNVNDADSSASNEIQDLDSVLKIGATTAMDIGTGSITIGAGETLCINKTCLTETQLINLLKLLP